jgi:glutathione S-transferase
VQGVYPIIEYFNEKTKVCKLMDQNPEIACEIRRLVHWFNNKFYREVSKWIIDEKLIRLLSRAGMPRTEFIRAAKANLTPHMQYISKLLTKRSYLAHDKISFADIAASGHLSCVDYFGEVIWDQYPDVKEWYSIIKSRPSFKDILNEDIPGFPPPKHYKDLDF